MLDIGQHPLKYITHDTTDNNVGKIIGKAKIQKMCLRYTLTLKCVQIICPSSHHRIRQ